MTARQRILPGDGTATATASRASQPAASAAPGKDGATASHYAFLWEEWYSSATLEQKQEMLSLAASQGMLYSQQIPPLANGRTRTANDSTTSPLANLLAGAHQDLSSIDCRTLPCTDSELDPLQREAVARALSTPDVFLLQGLPGTGKSRVVAEIIDQHVRQGQRVLFLADIPAAIDVALERLAGRDATYVIRFVGPGENSTDLSPCVQSWTLAERERAVRAKALASAALIREEAEARSRRRHQEETLWPRLRELANVYGRVQETKALNDERLARVPAEVDSEAAAGSASPADGWRAEIIQIDAAAREAVAALDSRLEELAKNRHDALHDIERIRLRLAKLRPLVEAKKARRWWTLAWWRASWRGNVQRLMAETEAQEQTATLTLTTLDAASSDLQEQRRVLEEESRAKRMACLAAETERRRDELRRPFASWQDEHDEFLTRWRQACDGLENRAHHPAAPTQAAIDEAERAWRGQRHEDEKARQFAAQWAEFGSQTADQLACRLPELANVLAGTTAALAHDVRFAEAAQRGFHLLIVEDADRFSESDLIRLARYASRCVLVAPVFEGNHAVPSATEVKRLAPPVALKQGGFAKLWHALHPDVGRLPYAWYREDDRLVCRLRAIAMGERNHLETEHVADFPQIELRIWAPPKTRPVLAQVAFPASMGIGQAKAFLYRELEEATVYGVGRSGWLRDNGGSWVFHLAPHPLSTASPVELEGGLREWVDPVSGRTCRLEFDAGSGWTRQRVDQWLADNLQGRDRGRTVFLQIPYRHGSWSETLGDILYSGEVLPGPKSDRHGGGFDFFPVPPLPAELRGQAGDRRRGGVLANGTNGLPREGAGLEQDLAVTRMADRLPAELRPFLPRKGFANYLEAEAIVRALEEGDLLSDADGAIGIIAPFEGQLELLRLLVGRSARLRQLSLVFGLPGQLQQREFNTVIVSLTRSHSHRAVPLGETSADLPLALTRARRRLVVFGDPGALVKRSQWQGPLDHLDPHAAAQEASRCAALVRYLHGQGNFPAGFRLRESPRALS